MSTFGLQLNASRKSRRSPGPQGFCVVVRDRRGGHLKRGSNKVRLETYCIRSWRGSPRLLRSLRTLTPFPSISSRRCDHVSCFMGTRYSSVSMKLKQQASGTSKKGTVRVFVSETVSVSPHPLRHRTISFPTTGLCCVLRAPISRILVHWPIV